MVTDDVPFRHDRPGTPAEVWVRALASHPTPILELPSTRRRLVVVGAHPDDETLGAGGLIHAAGAAGWRVDVISVTAGEGSHPHSPSHPPALLAQVRRDELRRAVSLLSPEVTATCLDVPDGEVATHLTDVVARLVDVVGSDGHEVLLCAPWRHDGHPDHEAVGQAAAIAAARTDAQLLEYPVWLWHWGQEDDLPWGSVRRLPLDTAARTRKRAAVAAHASQVQPLSDGAGDEVLLDPAVLAHFDRDTEVFLASDEEAHDDALDRVHLDRSDPWQVESSYERRKRALTLASFPRDAYGRALEVGCSIGALAVDLAGRCAEVVALDSSRTAVGLARERTRDLDHVDVRLARVPDEWPEGRFDLVSISEVGYFLSPRQLDEVVEKAFASLAPDGHLLLCHWRHQPLGWPLAGPAVHDAFLATGAPVLVEHQERDFLLHVLGGTS